MLKSWIISNLKIARMISITDTIKKWVIIALFGLVVLLTSKLWISNQIIDFKNTKITKLEKTITLKDEELKIIGLNINNTLEKERTDAKNDVIDTNSSIRSGVRRLY